MPGTVLQTIADIAVVSLAGTTVFLLSGRRSRDPGRCPKEVDLPRIMGFLRQESRRRGLTHPRARDVVDFHRFFLDVVRTGRPHETGPESGYRPRTRRFMQDMRLQPKLFLRGKLSPFPHRIHGSGEVARLFTKDKFKRD